VLTAKLAALQRKLCIRCHIVCLQVEARDADSGTFVEVQHQLCIRCHIVCVQVEARDADSGTFGEVQYEISSGNSQSAFIIDPPWTGIVKTTVPLDREIEDLYRLEVRDQNIHLARF